MKHQQVVCRLLDHVEDILYLLVISHFRLCTLKMIQTIFYLPGYLKNNQKRLEELAAKYNLDLEKEIAESEINTGKSKECFDISEGVEHSDIRLGTLQNSRRCAFNWCQMR
ncbi:hypothetical protein EVAR_101624_1 [Eumeta japonica]|uniref:Uncharacterized protein n=1 Tax=Eumeta variegata TaxID=151549 RepID=A0A4C1TFN9_EUMVA|nr:hypothetical protein EVAR_101624_1 [Eumeta japonica]